ncbi:hypothetical protein BTZ20_2917 [Rhodococcus sp. MTM3W5.2]|nr:hypothetical protein BTZ20_2917 [Rhodococcus sp. MTM3W5.2]
MLLTPSLELPPGFFAIIDLPPTGLVGSAVYAFNLRPVQSVV